MPATTQITDSDLLSVLETASQVREQCAQILSLLNDINNKPPTSTNEPPLDPSAIWSSQRTLTTQLARLRGQNRGAIQSVRATKSLTSEARNEVDSLHLKLQNLYYEQRHLRGEISGCREYEHKYLSLPMLPLESYLALHPSQSSWSEHDLTIARIEDEHLARQNLEADRAQLQQKKLALLRETAAKKEELAKLDAEMEKWVATARSGPGRLFEARERRLLKKKREEEEEAEEEERERERREEEEEEEEEGGE